MKDWLAQAWTDWIRPLGLLIVAGLAYLGYRFDLLGENVAGLGLVIAIVAGTIGVAVVPAWAMSRRSSQRAMLLLLGLLALVGAGWPSLRAAIATRPLATARLTTAQPSATLETGQDGPYDVIVSGRFKQAGASDVEASYTLRLEGQGSAQVSGAIKRALHRYRTSRRGGSSTSIEEHTEAIHRVDGVRGARVTVSTDGIDDQLDGGLQVGLRPAGPRPEIFWTLCAIALLIGLILDARLVVELREEDRKVRGPKREQSYLTVATAMLLVFAVNFPTEATPHSLVRAAIGAFFLALLAGGAGGWLLAAFVRLATKPRRRA
jgi:hypothetical protein